MKTKTYILTVVLTILATGIFAQGQKISFAVQAGINFQNQTGVDFLGDEIDNSLLTGFHAGANVIIPVGTDIYFQPGLVFSQKGASSTLSLVTIDYKMNYIDIPLNLLYRGKLGEGYVMVGFGPYVAFALSGKVIAGSVTSDIEFKNTIELTDPLTTTYMKSLDAGAGVFAGYETGFGIYIQLNTQIGLINISPEDTRVGEDNSSLKNVGFGVSVGYRF